MAIAATDFQLTNSNSADTLDVVFSQVPDDGDIIVLCAAIGSSSPTINTPSGFTLAEDTDLTSGGGAGTRAHIATFYKVASSEASATYTVTLSATARFDLTGFRITGGDATPLDQTAETGSGGTSVTSQASGTTATLAQAAELAVAVVGINSTNQAQADWAVDGDYTLQTSQRTPASSAITGHVVATKVVSATTAEDNTFTWTGAGKASAHIITFKGATGGAAEALAGSLDAAASASGSLKRARTVTSVAPAASSAQASLNRERPVAAVASASSSAIGDLTVQAAGIELAGSASAASSASATIRRTTPLSGTAAASSSSSASLRANVPIIGTSAAASGASGDLSVVAGIIVLEGSISGASSASGLLSATVPLLGIISGASQANGSLDTAAAVYIFRTPTFSVAYGKGSLWGRIEFPRGYSVLKTADGTYELRTGTRADEIEAALAFYQGGREYTVSLSEKDELEAAGFEVETV
jgi:hypothetical protein